MIGHGRVPPQSAFDDSPVSRPSMPGTSHPLQGAASQLPRIPSGAVAPMVPAVSSAFPKYVCCRAERCARALALL